MNKQSKMMWHWYERTKVKKKIKREKEKERGKTEHLSPDEKFMMK